MSRPNGVSNYNIGVVLIQFSALYKTFAWQFTQVSITVLTVLEKTLVYGLSGIFWAPDYTHKFFHYHTSLIPSYNAYRIISCQLYFIIIVALSKYISYIIVYCKVSLT